MLKKIILVSLFAFAGSLPANSIAGAQKEEALSNSVRAMMQRSISDKAAPKLVFTTPQEGRAWKILHENGTILCRNGEWV
jgi:hypothetical protein